MVESKNVSATASAPVVDAAAAPPRRICRGLMAFSSVDVLASDRRTLEWILADRILEMEVTLVIDAGPEGMEVAKAMAGPAEPTKTATAAAIVDRDILIFGIFKIDNISR